MSETGRMDTALACAYVRGRCLRTSPQALPDDLLKKPLGQLTESERNQLIQYGRQAEWKLYRFKNHENLPRVRKVISFLRAIYPESLLDVGSGRGVFLFPFLHAFPGVPVTSVDILPHRVEALDDIRRGGADMLTAVQQDITAWNMPDDSFDVVTLLEVLEHIPDVQSAVCAAVRLARRYVVVTVPSKPDDNPEHIHLLTKDILTDLFTHAGCTSLRFDGVPGHLLMIASV